MKTKNEINVNEAQKGKKRARAEYSNSPTAAHERPQKKLRTQKGTLIPTSRIILSVVIAFSSFKDDTPFDNAMKAKLTKLAQELGAEIQTAPQFEPQITHVVSRSIKLH